MLIDDGTQKQPAGESDDILQLNLPIKQKIQIITTFHGLPVLLHHRPQLPAYKPYQFLAVDLVFHGQQQQLVESDEVIMRLKREDVVIPQPEQQSRPILHDVYSL